MNANSTVFEIEKILVISTAHLPSQEYLDELSSNGAAPSRPRNFNLISIPTNYGVLVYVGGDSENFSRLINHYSDISVILVKARELGCSWVNFDQDGSTYSIFTSWDW